MRGPPAERQDRRGFDYLIEINVTNKEAAIEWLKQNTSMPEIIHE